MATQELVAARVTAESAQRRAALVEVERDRNQKTLSEAQVSAWTCCPQACWFGKVCEIVGVQGCICDTRPLLV